MTTAPQHFKWNGAAMVPLRLPLAQRVYSLGEIYRLAVEEERSAQTHRHFFACVNEAWRNLPHHLADQFPSPDHLRRRALIEAGFYDQEVIDCETPDVAERVAAFAGKKDDYALVSVSDAIVIVRTAKSQSVRAMPKDEFQRSKTAVLEILAQMLSITPAELAANAERAA